MSTFLSYVKLIHIHPVLIIFIIISFLTGTFVQIFIILCIVFIHEFGHYIVAKKFNWRIQSIVLWVFGGVMHTDEHSNRKIIEDILVTIAGPFQHLLIFLLLLLLSWTEMIPLSVLSIAFYYNKVILLFNLIPIYPLDGGKLLFHTLSLFVPLRKAHRFTILFSILVCICILLLQIFILPFTLSAFILIVFLLYENKQEWANRYYTFIRFLLHRLEKEYDITKSQHLFVPSYFKLIDIFSLFQKDKVYVVCIQDSNERQREINERDCLYEYFYKQKHMETIGEILNYSAPKYRDS